MNALTRTFTLPAIETLSTELVASNKVLADAVHDHIAPAMEAAGSRCPTGLQHKWFADLTAKAVWPDMKSPNAEKIAVQPEIEQAILVTVRAAVAEELPLLLAQAAATGDPKPYKPARKLAQEYANQVAETLRVALQEAA